MNKTDIISHARDRVYMSGIERDKARVKATGEIFTPTPLVNDVLDKLPQDVFLPGLDNTFLDPSCGDGQFLSEILIRKIENGVDFEEALSTIYGVDIMEDNVNLCRDRLLCGREDLRHIVESNILIGNTLNPLSDIPGQTVLDKSRMKELFYKNPVDDVVDELLSTGIFEIE